MARLASVNKNATLYLCTVQVTTGDFITGANWQRMIRETPAIAATRCPNHSTNKPRLGPDVNNGQPTAVCEFHVAQIRGGDAARSDDPAVVEACVDAATDTAWMREVESLAWLRAVAIVQTATIPFYASTLISESHAESAESAIAATFRDAAMRLYPMKPRKAVAQMKDDAVRGAIGRVIPHIVFTVALDNAPEIPSHVADAATDGFREDVLATMVSAGYSDEVTILRNVADSARIVEPTRADVNAWSSGECVTRIKRLKGSREAATVYVDFARMLDRQAV